jgi:hypothetical protein
MAIHATARIDWIQARLMGWLRTQTLTGSPAIGARAPCRAVGARHIR